MLLIGNECDVCGSKDKVAEIKDDQLAAFAGFQPGAILWMCDPCVLEWGRGGTNGLIQRILEVGEDVMPVTNIANLKKNNNNHKSGGTSYKPTTPVKTKCNLPHLMRIYFPALGEEGGIILSANKGSGGAIHEDADYALFFDKGWEKVLTADPVTNINAEDNELPPVPDLSNGFKARPHAQMITWRDFGAPPPFMKNYVEWAIAKVSEGLNVQIGCIGGHGRTGTFAAAFIGKVLGLGWEEAIDKLRTMYCDEAVESSAQKDWLKNYLGE